MEAVSPVTAIAGAVPNTVTDQLLLMHTVVGLLVPPLPVPNLAPPAVVLLTVKVEVIDVLML